jgi:hypothetical protein
MSLDMTEIHRAESRLGEIAVMNPAATPELISYFNQACNQVSKYLAWLSYEILEANKTLDLAKAVVVCDKMPDEVQKLQAKGVKSNEDFRAALIARDPECQAAQDTLNILIAAQKLLDGKFWSFIRAYNSAMALWERKGVTPSPNLSTAVEGSHGGTNVMGRYVPPGQ